MIFDYVTSPLSLLVCLLDSMIAIIFVTIPYDLIKFRRFNYLCLFMFVCTFFWIVGLIKKIVKVRRMNKKYGKYPCNDYLNNAIRFLLRNKEGDRELAIEEIVYAIHKADGRIYDDLARQLKEFTNGR